jgi:hypothetical protein
LQKAEKYYVSRRDNGDYCSSVDTTPAMPLGGTEFKSIVTECPNVFIVSLSHSEWNNTRIGSKIIDQNHFLPHSV